ncbi:MAG TPA: valine--tRNA ligase, partial [Candidatus Binatia bacterium]|nr:valine--tRNA ligase [Candidatus Binatia bacterium]
MPASPKKETPPAAPAQLDKAYEPKAVEDRIYAAWEGSGFFNPDNLPGKRAESFTIMMPPPNATGTLHIGHAMFMTLEDLMTRFHRMRGKAALWVPGTDHAAIATNTKVEKILAKEGKTKYDLGREGFIERVKDYIAGSQGTIRKQIRKMGSSCDWSREAYTFDEPRSRAVREIFGRMFADGLIYRGIRIVNWCPRCESTLADDEVEYKEEAAKLYYLKYGPFTVATTRPETKLGDTAVAVHPEDKRYKKWHGKKFAVDFGIGPQEIRVITDAGVDMNFGSGVVGVTPAHSAVDFAMAEKNLLPVKKVIGEDGRMTAAAGLYKGMTVVDAREKFVAALKAKGLLEKIEDMKHNLSVCYRCGTPVEPLTSRQWFVDVDRTVPKSKKSLKRMSLDAVRSGAITIVPDRFEKVYFNWMENLHDWCISRQIWFGHRIPVWYCAHCYVEEDVAWKAGADEHETKQHTGITLGIEGAPQQCKDCGRSDLTEDPDTLDTWFSSGTWTFSTLGWPEKTADLKKFHPTQVLETGYDILFFWIARMILMTTYATGEIPFETVYLHGLVRDDKGRKMSKSLENIIDPLDVAEKYGTDAVRLSLVIGNTPGNDLKMSEDKIAYFRNFTNKLWNISRFIVMTCGAMKAPKSRPVPKTLADKWILGRLDDAIASVTRDIEAFNFSRPGETLRDFTWNDLAD